jgi:hypothetical protein
MKASDLVTVWSAPDNSRLTAKQYSFRLPVHVAAKLAALEDLYPTKSRTQLVGDLLAAALVEIVDKLPTYATGKQVDEHPETGEAVFEAGGPGVMFRNSANKYYAEIEREMGNENPDKLYPHALYVTEDEK